MKVEASKVSDEELKTFGYSDEEIKIIRDGEKENMDVDDFAERFTEIYSFTELNIGEKGCRNCRHFRERLSDREADAVKNFMEISPAKNTNMGVCKTATAMAAKTIDIDHRGPMFVSANGRCTLFKASILKSIKRLFLALFSVCPGDEDCHSKIRCRGCEK